jgi:hypothetical protein
MKNYSNEIAELEVLIAGVKKEYSELQIGNALKVKEVLDSYFNPFQELEIQVGSTSASFYMKDNLGNRREVFSLYFYQRLQGNTLLELSYYTTSTHSDFELERLINLGKVAKIVLEKSEQILREISEVRNQDLGRSNELFSIQNGYEKKIQEYKNAERESKLVEVELSLRGEGVVFNDQTYIQLKRNYTVRVIQMRIAVSKSGKTCDVFYITSSGYKGVENNCNVKSVVDQVALRYESIVSTSELV